MVPAASNDPDLSAPELDQHATDVRNAAVMSVGTLLSRATGVIRVSVTVAAIGTLNPVANAYFIANTTPNIVYELILGGILTSVFVPLLVDWGKRHGDEEGQIAGQRFLTFVLVVLSVVTIVAMILAPWIMRLYLIGVKGPADHAAQLELGTFFLRWFLPQIVFYGIGAVAAGILTAHRRFAAQMYAPVLNNVAVIGTMPAACTVGMDAETETVIASFGGGAAIAGPPPQPVMKVPEIDAEPRMAIFIAIC